MWTLAKVKHPLVRDSVFCAKYRQDNPDYCEVYQPYLVDGLCKFSHDVETQVCQADSEIVYAEFEMEESVATLNNLVCENYPWISIIDCCNTMGLLVGAFVFGILSDKYGRRHSLLLASICCALGNLLGSLFPDKVTYAFSRIIAGAGAEGCVVATVTMRIEMSGVYIFLPICES